MFEMNLLIDWMNLFGQIMNLPSICLLVKIGGFVELRF